MNERKAENFPTAKEERGVREIYCGQLIVHHHTTFTYYLSFFLIINF